MFTLDQIKVAYDNVKSAADFPIYIQNLINMGVKGYDTLVADGRVRYYGENDFATSTEQKYELLTIAPVANKERFIEFLVLHESGQTDYYTFCQQAAQCGIAKSRIDIVEMTCTYGDSNNNPILIEKIPF